MGVSNGHGKGSTGSYVFRPQKLPVDISTLALGPEACHCVADAELENRYNMLRAEEHARKDGKCGPEWSTDVANRKENAERNRYASVVPWDHSRVILPVEDGENDYINASWVELGSRTYIATQGPLASTVTDFWHMVYAYGGEPAVIIMLTPLYEHAVEKCAKYWPGEKSHPVEIPEERGFKFGLTISLVSQHRSDQYKYSCFTITPHDKNYQPHTVHHVYYHSWLDYTKPNADADLRSLIHLVNNKLRNRACPPIVHCSAGIGRTGTFIALDALLSRIDTDILPAILPRCVPVWRANQRTLQFRASLFTGQEDIHSDSDNNSPLLSKFDVAKGSVAASMKSAGDETNSTTAVLNIKKQIAKGGQQNNTSRLSDAILQSRTPSQIYVQQRRDEQLGYDPAFAEDAEVTEPSQNGKTILQPPEGLPNDMASADLCDTCEAPKSSTLSGPVIRKVAAKITSVSPEVFSETPASVDVMQWFDHKDAILSAIRTLRKQRPKMVQGKQQLGYIYDQFEVGQQLARATYQHNDLLKRRSTMPSLLTGSPSSASSSHLGSSHHGASRKILSFMRRRRNSHGSIQSENDAAHSNSPASSFKLKSLFSSSVLK